MPGHDPENAGRPLIELGSLDYFSNRKDELAVFESYVNARSADDLRVLVFYGVGGVGKTMLANKLGALLSAQPPGLPHARFDMETIRSAVQAYREVLLNLRHALGTEYGLDFPRFDLCLALQLALEGGDPPPLVRTLPWVGELLKFGTSIVGAPLAELRRTWHLTLRKMPKIEAKLRQLGGTEEVLRLRRLGVEELPAELVRLFAVDLKNSLPPRAGCRAVLFLDTYERLWRGRTGDGSAQARELEAWVRDFAGYCPSIGVLQVICGRDRLRWQDSDPGWENVLDQRLLGGLSAGDAQYFLARCGIGASPELPPDPLQQAIIRCCDEDPTPAVACHPLYLSLCAAIVLNTRANEGHDPAPETFDGIPSEAIAATLADRFLRSLPNDQFELWLLELSLTPRFDETAALALDRERSHFLRPRRLGISPALFFYTAAARKLHSAAQDHARGAGRPGSAGKS